MIYFSYEILACMYLINSTFAAAANFIAELNNGFILIDQFHSHSGKPLVCYPFIVWWQRSNFCRHPFDRELSRIQGIQPTKPEVPPTCQQVTFSTLQRSV